MPAVAGAGMASKREREEDNAVFKALQELESVIDRDSDTLKIQVSPTARLAWPVKPDRGPHALTGM